MQSPFPGMDPYLEGEEWHDVHQALATEIRKQLAPLIEPRYIARLAVATQSDIPPQQEIEVMYPDVELLLRRRKELAHTPLTASSTSALGVAIADTPITRPVIVPLTSVQVRLVTVEIREVEQNRLVTSIEILSPVNKRKPGIGKFLKKRQKLMGMGVHLLDIDLIRRGTRPVTIPPYTESPEVLDAPYLVMLTRAKASKLEVWPIEVTEKLPTVAVPLRPPDPDIPLDLAATLATVYADARFDLSIDYSEDPPPPAFDEQTNSWMNKLLNEYKTV